MKLLRTYISSVLICIILGATGWQSLTIISFYANQDEIAAKHCINKDKPELQCHGKCHLKKKLEPSVKKENPESSRIIVNAILVFQAYEDIDAFELEGSNQLESQKLPYSFIIKTSDQSGLLDPPEIS